MARMTVDEYMEKIEEQRRAPGRKIEAIEKRLEQIAATVESTTDIDAIEKLYAERDGLQDKLEPMREAFTQHWVGFAPVFHEYLRYKQLRHMSDAEIRSAHLPKVRINPYSESIQDNDYPEFSQRISELRNYLKEEPVRCEQAVNMQHEQRAKGPWYRKLLSSLKGEEREEGAPLRAPSRASVMGDYSHLTYYFAEQFKSRSMRQQTYDLLMNAPFEEIYERINNLPREKRYPKNEKERIDL